jgi:fibronectin type 3 domain-containing protein
MLIRLVFLMLMLKGCPTGGHYASGHWNAIVAPAGAQVVYDVYRSPHGKNTFVLLNPAEIVGTTFNDTSVIAGAAYDYYVQAVDLKGVYSASAPSATFTVTVP